MQCFLLAPLSTDSRFISNLSWSGFIQSVGVLNQRVLSDEELQRQDAYLPSQGGNNNFFFSLINVIGFPVITGNITYCDAGTFPFVDKSSAIILSVSSPYFLHTKVKCDLFLCAGALLLHVVCLNSGAKFLSSFTEEQ